MAGTTDEVVRQVRELTVPLATVDPTGSLDDLEPLRELVSDARVVAIGESTHHVQEFFLFRHRFTRFLVERCGFTHVAVEAPFSEGVPLGRWVEGGPGDVKELAAVGMHFDMGLCRESIDLFEWLREHNRTAATPVPYSGIDLPATLASMVPAMEAVAEYVRSIDADTLALVEQALEVGRAYAGDNLFVSVPRYIEMAAQERHDLTAALAHLVWRFEYLRPYYAATTGRDAYEVAKRHLKSAWCLDLYHREMEAVWNERGIFAEGSARDAFMADTVSWLLERAGPDARIVLAAHNSHIQRVPWSTRNAQIQGSPLTDADDEEPVGPAAIAHFMMGNHLAEDLGDRYVVVAVTSGSGSTVEWNLDPEAPKGIRVEELPLPPPAEGSIEAIMAESGTGLRALDLRALRAAGHKVDRMLMQDRFFEIPVLEAFDVLVHVPTATATDYVTNLAAVQGSSSSS